MRRVTELEKRVARVENRRPFQLRYFLKIESESEHDVFDRAKVGDEFFMRLDDESDNQFCERIMNLTNANPIWMFPHSIESDYMAPCERNITQSKTLPSGVKEPESGSEEPHPAPTLSRIDITE